MPIDVEPLTLAGKLVVWGDNSQLQVRDTPPGKFRALAPGGAGQSLAIDEDGALVLWGGVGAAGPIVTALPGDSGSGVSQVHGLIRGGFVNAALGLSHLIAVRHDGSILRWGNYLGTTKVSLPDDLLAIDAAAGAAADVVIGIDGTLTKLGNIADPPLGTFTKVRARSNYAIALSTTGRLFGWGGDLFGNLTDWTSDGAGHFYIDGPFTDLAAGIVQKDPGSPAWPHVLALHANGNVMGWGTDRFGEASGAPGAVKFKAIAAGLTYSLGIDVGGELHHWGNRWSGTGLGMGTGVSLSRVPKGKFFAISAGSRHATAIRDSRIGLHAGPDAARGR